MEPCCMSSASSSVDRMIRLALLLCSAIAVAAAMAQDAERQPRHPPDIYFVGTPQPVVNAMLALARVTDRDVVYDLGSGDGRIVILAAQQYGARGVGIEIQPRLVEMARQTAREGRVADRVTFIEDDLFEADISQATVVMLWLSPFVNARLEPKLRRELRPGTRIVSHQFPIGQWKPDATVHAEYDNTEIFLWTIPAPAHDLR